MRFVTIAVKSDISHDELETEVSDVLGRSEIIEEFEVVGIDLDGPPSGTRQWQRENDLPPADRR